LSQAETIGQFLADQAIAIEDENQEALDVHCFARWRDLGKRATVRTAKLALDNDRIIRVVELERMEPEVLERWQPREGVL
jgi:hypothetical protein